MNRYVLALDLGASSGRAMLAAYDGEKIRLREVHRFSNDPVAKDGRLYWNVPQLMREIEQGMQAAYEIAPYESIAIDTWGVDYGLLKADGTLLELPRHYRDSCTSGILKKAEESITAAENLPCSAMAAGADMASVSIHKTGGSLTQSAMLLCAEGINADYVRQVINLTQTTSASYLLMVSLDIARRNLALNGREMYRKAVQYVDYAREEINRIGGYYVYGDELCNGDSFYAFDRTKLSIHTRNTGLAGIEVYDLLRDEYGIQIEFGDIGNILAIVTAGDRALEIERLISALSEIKRLYGGDPTGMLQSEYLAPDVALPPQQAFYADKKAVPLEQSIGEICSEFVMCYPPGIPILAPGERITGEILDYIEYAKSKGCSMTGPEDPKIEHINILTDGGKPHGIMV